MLKQCLDISLFGIHVGYTIAKLEFLHRIILGILNFGYWYSLIALISSIIAICACDIKFDILSNNDVLNCLVRPIFHYTTLISKIDDKICKLVSKNKYSIKINEWELKFSYWIISVLIRYIQHMFSNAHDAVAELLRTNQIFDAILHIDHRTLFGDDPMTALRTSMLNGLRNTVGGGNVDNLVIHPHDNNNNASEDDLYRMFGLQHRRANAHVNEFVFGPEGIIRATPANESVDHVPVNAEFRHEPTDTDDESDEDIDSDDDPIIALNAAPHQEQELVQEQEIQQPMEDVM